MRTKATLTLNVIFQGEDATASTCKLQLEDLVRFAANRGLLTGDLSMVTDDFDYEVKITELEDEDDD